MRTQVKLKLEESQRTLLERQMEREERRLKANQNRNAWSTRPRRNNIVNINRKDEQIIENINKILQEEKKIRLVEPPPAKIEIFKLLGIE